MNRQQSAMLVSALFALLYMVLALRWHIPWPVGAGYLALSLCTFALYAWDKSAARSGRRRIRERTLHVWALLGGWPGALLARTHLRHKSSKASFQAAFWSTAALNVGAFIALSSPAIHAWRAWA